MSKNDNAHIDGIDHLRAVMSVFVVIWHVHGAGRSLLFSRSNLDLHRFTVSDLINYHVLLLAVPVFILVSNYLFVRQGADVAELKRRTYRLFALLLFWTFALVLYQRGLEGVSALLPRSMPELLINLFSAGGTIYYFFLGLVLTLLMAYLFNTRPDSTVAAGCVLSLLLLFGLPYAARGISAPWLVAPWNPLNFAPYPFAAILLSRHSGRIAGHRAWYIVTAGVIAALFAVYEWQYNVHSVFSTYQGFALPAYTRISVLFSVIALLIVMLHPKIRSGTVIRFMADRSLSLYCLHPFLLLAVWPLISRLAVHDLIRRNAAALIAIICCYAIASLDRYFPGQFRKASAIDR